MDIVKYIKDLLYRHDCVILPGFGGFVASYRNAQIMEEKNSFLPPAKEIRFNSKLNTNDGLLINHISLYEGITYNNAWDSVGTYVANINEKLKQGSEVNFDGIGSFRCESEENLNFEPEVTDNFLIESFGLTTVRFPVLEDRKIIQHPAIAYTDTETLRRLDTSSRIRRAMIAASFAIALSLFPLKTVIDGMRHQISALRPSGSEIVAVNPAQLLKNPGSVSKAVEQLTHARVALYYSEDMKEGEESPATSTGTTTPVLHSLQPETPTDDTIREHVENNIVEQPAIRHDVPKEVNTEVIDSKGTRFYIIAGSFRNKEQARKWMPNLTNKGLDAVILPKEDGHYRISVGSFGERSDADKELQLLRARNIPTWILTKS